MSSLLHRERLRTNLGKNYVFLGLSYVDLTRGLWMIWLSLQGFSLTQLGVMEGIFHITSFLMEVPTGIVADLAGRKTSRLMGRIFFLASLVILYLSRSLSVQCLGFALTAISYNLESGAGEALVYDSMKELGEEDRYKKAAGINNAIFEIGSVASLLIGGYFAAYWGYAWVFLPSFGICALTVVVAALFEEPQLVFKEQHRLRKLGWRRAMVEQTRESVRVVAERPRIAFIILFTEFVMMFITSLYFYLQTFWKSQGLDEFRIGLYLAIAGILSAVSGILAGRIEARIGVRGILFVSPAILIVSLWGVGLTDWGVLFYAITGFANGVLYVAVQDYLNANIPSERRATILSFQSMTFSLYMTVVFPIIGFIGDRRGLKFSFVVLAAVASVLYLAFVIIAGRRKEKT